MWTNKEEVLSTLKGWIEKDASLADNPIASGNGRTFTMKEMIQEIENDTENGKSMLEAALSNTSCDEGCGCDHE